MITSLYQYSKLLRGRLDLAAYFSPAENPFEGREENGKVLNGIVENGKFLILN